MTSMEWFARFPALWAFTGTVIGGILTSIAWWLVYRRVGTFISNEMAGLAEIHKQQVASQRDLLEMENQRHEAQVKTLLEKHEIDVLRLTNEREKVRDEKHTAAQEWGVKSLEYQLKIQELENRPDLSSLSELLTRNTSVMEGIAHSIEQHDNKIDERMKQYLEPVRDAFEKTAQGLAAVLERLPKRRLRAV
jgi:enoyl-[acyl-carrier-protein] reductase (NADH)